MNADFARALRHGKNDDRLLKAKPDAGITETDPWAARLALAPRACCCPARPAVIAIMPARNGRPEPTDLLLCGHHYRIAEAGLKAAGAVIHGATPWWH